MILFFIFIITIILLIVSYQIIDSICESYVNKNSILLARITEINNKYHFDNIINYDQKNTYDNEIYYNSISPEDYLIYQLQFNYYKIAEQIRKTNINKNKYNEYINEINKINIKGRYYKEPNKRLIKILNRYEDKMSKKMLYQPVIHYNITVTLYLSKINGEKYRKKSDIFNSNQIFILIHRLQDKNGKYFNDPEIWNAICRVERGKVTNKMRFYIYKRDGNRCRYCHRYGNDLEVDHIIPIAKGGKSTPDNLQTLCRRCNVEKGDKIV